MSADPNEFTSTVLGAPARAWEYGDPNGAPLVMVHGFRGDHHGLDGLARAVAERLPSVRVLVPDLPGFGRTPPVPGRQHDLELYGEWLDAFARSAAPDGFGVLGHSFGSLVVANAMGQGLPASSIILVNPIASPALQGPQALLTALAIAYYRAGDRLPERPARALLGHPLIVRGMSEVMAKTPDPALRRWIHDQHHRYFSDFSDTRTLLDAFRASVSHTVGENAAAFVRPTLLIAGDRDDITPLTAQLDLARRLPDSRLRILPGVGHLVHYEAVAEAAAEVTRFLAEVASVRSGAQA